MDGKACVVLSNGHGATGGICDVYTNDDRGRRAQLTPPPRMAEPTFFPRTPPG